VRGRKAKVQQVRVVAAYCRVSKREQAEQGGSLPAQENKLRALAELHGRNLDRVFVDGGYSAGTLKRPAVQELLGCIERGEIEAVYISKLDRLVRDLSDLLAIVKLCEKHDVALISASEHIDTGSPAGRMMLSMLGAFAEFERARISERIKDVAFDKRQQKRVYSGNAPFGYKREGNDLVEHAHEQQALANMRVMHNDGASYRQIATWLTQTGFKPKGRAWYASSVKAVLESQMNTAA
jgi:site-specific DNA recombinase